MSMVEAQKLIERSFETTHAERGEQATAILGIIFGSAALVASVALVIFSLGIVTAPVFTFTITLWSSAGSALAALIMWIFNRVLQSNVAEARVQQQLMLKLSGAIPNL